MKRFRKLSVIMLSQCPQQLCDINEVPAFIRAVHPIIQADLQLFKYAMLQDVCDAEMLKPQTLGMMLPVDAFRCIGSEDTITTVAGDHLNNSNKRLWKCW